MGHARHHQRPPPLQPVRLSPPPTLEVVHQQLANAESGSPAEHLRGEKLTPRSAVRRGRLVDRQAAFGQSNGTFNIVRRLRDRTKYAFYLGDWFHTLVNTKSYRIVTVVVLVYLILFSFFALLYMATSELEGCAPELRVKKHNNETHHNEMYTTWRRFLRALFFSLETMMTIGYGVDDPYFGNCPVMLLVIGAQSLVGVFTSSILFGIVLMRVSRADKRGALSPSAR